MASLGFIKTLLNGIEDVKTRQVLTSCFEEVMRQARIGDSDKAENFAWFQVEGVTSSVANQEFSVLHGMEVAPNRFIPSIRLDTVGAQLVPLVMSRAPDNRRAYFKSSSTSATFQGHFE